ncbi:MAG: GNAT family N-acetyltransferase [Candidatus Hermodarchaeota archaeon]|nr:GNAT family N-acetyltransferase [Candidatus Hermodarchaeota archaeon]
MTDELDLEIVEGYRKDLAKPMAAMFNSWDELWPGGFTQGVPMTPERVDKDFGSQRTVMQLIALDKTTNETVGYCSLLQHWRDKEAAYIGLLGVSPQALGKKVGKQLLLRSMEIATQNGFERVDLHTWAGNLRAVPLYKKMGLMWDPEGEGVHLRGYIPGILQHPLCALFFNVHDAPLGWYVFQQRDLAQAPDDMQQNGMKVFSYSFQADSDVLHVVVDRYASAISGVEYTVADQRLKVNARVKDHLVFCGIPSEYILEVENGLAETCSVYVQLEGFSGLHFQSSTEHSLVIPPNESTVIVAPFSLDATTPIFRKDFKSPVITANLEINGKKAQLQTGLKIQSAAEIQLKFGHCRIVPGGKVEFPVTIQNNTVLPLEGTIQFHLPDAPISVSPVETGVKLKSEGVAGLAIDVLAAPELNPGTYDIWASLQLQSSKDTNVSVTTRQFRIPIFNIAEGNVAIGEDDWQRRIIVAGRDYFVEMAREGGTVTIPFLFGIGGSLFLRREIGPPFGLSPFRYAEQDIQVDQQATSTQITLSAEHFERPLLVETRVILEKNSPVIQQETWVTNNGSESHTFQLRLIGPGGIIVGGGKSILPLTSGIVEDRLSSLLVSYPAISSNPDSFMESWVAASTPTFTRGQVWNPENVEEVRIGLGRIGRLSYRPVTLSSAEKRRISQVFYVARAIDWNEVRRVWQERVEKRISLQNEEQILMETSSPMRIAPPPIIIPHRDTIKRNFSFQYVSTSPQTGEFTIEPPPGWIASLRLQNEMAAGTSVLVENVTGKNLPQLHLVLRPSKTIPDQFAIFTGQASWQIPVGERQSFPIVQLGSSKDVVEITEEEDQGLTSFRISNGVLEFKVSAEYGGCLYSLKNSLGTELLRTAFPTPTPNVFQQNYHGGWQPFVSGIDEEIFQATTNQEKMRVKTCKIGDIWKGVEIRWKGKLQPCCRGVDFTLQYLTAPGSPLILSNWEIRNSTTAALRLLAFQGLDPAFNGDLSGAILRTQWGDTLTDLRGSPIPAAFMPDSNFTWLQRNPTKNDVVESTAFLNSGTQPSLLVLLTHEFSWIFSYSDLFLRAKEKRTLRSAIFINPLDGKHIKEIQHLLDVLF